MTDAMIPRRSFGSTDLQVSVLGLGGFHQVEISRDDVIEILDLYLASGGNYVETARSYGRGQSEHKLGRALEGRRDQVILVSKTGQRDAEGAWRELNESLEALRTDHLDILLYHGLNDVAEVERASGPGGAAEAFARAREEGLVRLFGASTHWPLVLIPAMERLSLDAVMYWVNYLVPCNYPELLETVAPAARARGLGIIGMKPVGDGYLYRSAPEAFAFALAQEVDVLACGFNSIELLRKDLEIVSHWQQPSSERLATILREAPELGDYVCRQCGQCRMEDMDLPRVFELEGKFDRQMFDGRPTDTLDYALRQRLCYWFNNQARAIELFKPMSCRVERFLASDAEVPSCPYGIDIRRKLQLAYLKLTSDGRFPAGPVDF
ncbi:MAG: aldo/keto reductase [Anaerolineae bacterium]|nr:aldo/keto reductase [Anaerolineae bacterium]